MNFSTNIQSCRTYRRLARIAQRKGLKLTVSESLGGMTSEGNRAHWTVGTYTGTAAQARKYLQGQKDQ